MPVRPFQGVSFKVAVESRPSSVLMKGDVRSARRIGMHGRNGVRTGGTYPLRSYHGHDSVRIPFQVVHEGTRLRTASHSLVFVSGLDPLIVTTT